MVTAPALVGRRFDEGSEGEGRVHDAIGEKRFNPSPLSIPNRDAVCGIVPSAVMEIDETFGLGREYFFGKRALCIVPWWTQSSLSFSFWQRPSRRDELVSSEK